MKKIIVLGFLLLIALFTPSSKKHLTKQTDIYNKNESTEKQLLINNNNNHRMHKFDEPNQITIEISDKQQEVKQFSKHRKGKIIYTKNNTKTQNIVYE